MKDDALVYEIAEVLMRQDGFCAIPGSSLAQAADNGNPRAAVWIARAWEIVALVNRRRPPAEIAAALKETDNG